MCDFHRIESVIVPEPPSSFLSVAFQVPVYHSKRDTCALDVEQTRKICVGQRKAGSLEMPPVAVFNVKLGCSPQPLPRAGGGGGARE